MRIAKGRRGLAVALGFALVASGCQANTRLPTIDLTQQRFTREDSRVNQLDWAEGPQPPLTKVWSYDANESLGQPFAASGRVVASSMHQTYAFDNAGRLAWAFRPPRDHNHDGVRPSVPYVFGGQVMVAYVRDEEVTIRAMGLQDGKLRWTFTRPAPQGLATFLWACAGESLILSVGFPSLSDRGGRLPNVWRVGLDGSEIWGKHFNGTHLNFVSRGDLLAVGSDAGVDMIGVKDGALRWRHKGPQIDTSDFDAFAFAGEGLVVGENQDTGELVLLVFDPKTGRVLARRAVNPGASDEGNLYAYAPGRLYTYDPVEGRFRRWTTAGLQKGRMSQAVPFTHFLLIDPTDDDPVRGYYSDDEKELVFLSKSRVIWKAPLPPTGFLDDLFNDYPAGGIAATGSGVFVTTTSGWIFAFAPTSLIRR
ncbi:MAG: PQQ-binding-like beta-propeller repeat protein [Actinomycetota bacterium]